MIILNVKIERSDFPRFLAMVGMVSFIAGFIYTMIGLYLAI